MITREQVADLQPGDLVRVAGYPTMHGGFMSGPLWAGEEQKLCIGPFIVRHRDGDPPMQRGNPIELTLTVLARKPRPLYVNHPRTEPVAGDVVIDGEGVVRHVYRKPRNGSLSWWSHDYEDGFGWTYSDHPPTPLRLLVDGETGQIVQ